MAPPGAGAVALLALVGRFPPSAVAVVLFGVAVLFASLVAFVTAVSFTAVAVVVAVVLSASVELVSDVVFVVGPCVVVPAVVVGAIEVVVVTAVVVAVVVVVATIVVVVVEGTGANVVAVVVVDGRLVVVGRGAVGRIKGAMLPSVRSTKTTARSTNVTKSCRRFAKQKGSFSHAPSRSAVGLPSSPRPLGDSQEAKCSSASICTSHDHAPPAGLSKKSSGAGGGGGGLLLLDSPRWFRPSHAALRASKEDDPSPPAPPLLPPPAKLPRLAIPAPPKALTTYCTNVCEKVSAMDAETVGVAVGRADSDEDGADDLVALPVGERSVVVGERERGGVDVWVRAAESDPLSVGELCKDSEAVGTAVSEWEELRVAVCVGGPLESDCERFPPALRDDVPFSVGVVLRAAEALLVVVLATSVVDGGGAVVGASVAFEDGGSEGVAVSLLNPSSVLFVTLSLLVTASVAFASFGVVKAVLLPSPSAVVTLALTTVEVIALTIVSVVLATAVSFVSAAVPLVAFPSLTAVKEVLNSPAVELSPEVALCSPPPVLDGSVD